MFLLQAGSAKSSSPSPSAADKVTRPFLDDDDETLTFNSGILSDEDEQIHFFIPTKRRRVNNTQENTYMSLQRIIAVPDTTTTADISIRKTIEGFIYHEEVGEGSIACSCHGTFLNPAEFVKHTDEARDCRHDLDAC